MKALLFHCSKYKIKVGRIANRPKDINPEKVKEKEQTCKDCIVVFTTIEKGDNLSPLCLKLIDEIKKNEPRSQAQKHCNTAFCTFIE